VEDPAADLAVATAIASAFREQLVMPETIVLGEVGLAGEIRSVSQAILRINEAEKLGFKHCILPRNNYKNLENYRKEALELIAVSTLKEALDIALRG
jgi:DNA repair protein RadA/Sms